jgi:hypothetical protein
MDDTSDDLGLEDGGDEETPEGDSDAEMPADDAGSDMPAEGGADAEMPGEGGDEPAEEGGDEGPGMETEDISGDMQGDDQKIAQLASQYEIDELIKALALKTDAASMMEGQDGMSYGEMPEGLKKAMEAKKEGNEPGEDEEKEKTEDMGEKVPGAEEPSDAGSPPSEDVKGAEESKGEEVYGEKDSASCAEDEEDEEKKKMSDMAEETTPEEATGTLDHSEPAMGVQGDLQTRVAELEEELARQKKLMREKEIGDFAETLYSQAKLTEQIVSKTDLVRFMETLNSKNSVNFSEAGKASQFDFFKGVLENLPSMVSFEEFATQASAPKGKKQIAPSVDGYVYDPNTADLHAQALEYAESKGVDYTIALKAILSDS